MKIFKIINKFIFGAILLASSCFVFSQSTMPACKGSDIRQWHSCRGVVDENEYSYAGEFMIGKFEGRGVLEFTADKFQGDYYQGEFKNGLKHGFGTYFFSNGDKYIGNYQYGKREGKGTYSFSSGKQSLTGTWSNNDFLTKNNNDSESELKNKDVKSLDLEKKKIDKLGSVEFKGDNKQKTNIQTGKVIGKVRDAVAIVIGIQNYKNLPQANYAINDAIRFKDHAIKFLGVKPENVKLLSDTNAQRADILLAVKYWLPANVNPGKTDVYVYFSGHGLSQDQVKQQYLLPFDVNTDLLDETAINQKNLFKQISSAGGKSVIVFLDTCFSGVNRLGQTLVQNQRAVNMKRNIEGLPAGFSVLSASSNLQNAYGDENLQHGIFTFFLLNGISEAQNGSDTKPLTLGKLAEFVTHKTRSFALSINKQQDPKFIGDQQQLVVY
jgi:hypothetical protein